VVSGLYLIIDLSSKAAVNDWLRYDLTENLSVYFSGWKKTYFTKVAILYKFWSKVLEVKKFEPVIVLLKLNILIFQQKKSISEERISFSKEKPTCESSWNRLQIVIRRPRLAARGVQLRLMSAHMSVSERFSHTLTVSAHERERGLYTLTITLQDIPWGSLHKSSRPI
jgi:hypothetical protein